MTSVQLPSPKGWAGISFYYGPWLALLLLPFAPRCRPLSRAAERFEQLMGSRWVPPAVCLTTMFIMWVVWISLNAIPQFHDEAAYLLQADIFASFHGTAPSPPLPEFFQQYHVFVAPRLYAKYPPGQPLMLVPGVWLGAPALMLVVLTSVGAGLLFAIARRLQGGLVAILAWLVWLSSYMVLHWSATYLSEPGSATLLLACWWALLRHREDGRRRWLLLVALAVGWGAITRPQTWALLSIPVAVVLLPRLIRARAWADIGWAVAACTACLTILAGWSWEATGSPYSMPWVRWAATYLPSDRLGFGAPHATPAVELPPDMKRFAAQDDSLHTGYTIDAVPRAAVARLHAIQVMAWPWPRSPLPYLAILGALPLTGEILFGLASAALVFAGYLLYAHSPSWAVYYLELAPMLGFLSALGIVRLSRLVASRAGASRSASSVSARYAHQAGALVFLVALLSYVPQSVRIARGLMRERTAYHAAFRDAVAKLHGSRLVIFARYAPGHLPGFSVVRNHADTWHARAWVVYDRGVDDLRLTRLAPDRTPYLYDEAHELFVPLDTTSLARQPASTSPSARGALARTP